MMKKIALGLAVLVILVAGGVYYLFSNLDSLIKMAVESYGSEATQAKVNLGGVKLAITSGEGALTELKVGNPKGFATPEAMSLGLVSLKIDPASLQQTPIVIREIVIERPKITYEHASGGSNLETIQKNAHAYAQKLAGGKGASGSGSGGAAKDGKEEKKLVIQNLYIRDGQISVTAAALQGKTLDSKLPTIHLTDIGKSSGGATPAEVADKVLGSITQAASKVAVADLAKQATEQLKGAAGAVTAPGGATDRLKGLLPK